MFSSHLPLLKVNCPTLNMQYFVDFVLFKQHATQLASCIVHVTISHSNFQSLLFDFQSGTPDEYLI